MRILYCSCLCSEKTFKELFEKTEKKPGQQVQKYNRTLLHGLALQKGLTVEGLSKLPVQRDNYSGLWLCKKKEEWNGIKLNYLPCINIPLVNNLAQVISAFWCIMRYDKRECSVCLDVLNISMGLGVSLACKWRKIPLIGIVTDLPEQLVPDTRSGFVRHCKKIIGRCDGYVLLTEAMNEAINHRRQKPYVVIEGQVDCKAEDVENQLQRKYKKKVCMYTGSLNRIHGISYLVEGFLKADLENAELHVYGDGDYVQEFLEIAARQENIKYFGVKLNEEVVREQMKATLLINPRPTGQEFTKYSFPSKNMEYMASGTPMLTTKLAGMPKEYYPYIFLLEDESAAGMAKALKNILSMDREVLHAKGLGAKKFVMANKTGKMQAEKIVEMIHNMAI